MVLIWKKLDHGIGNKSVKLKYTFYFYKKVLLKY